MAGTPVKTARRVRATSTDLTSLAKEFCANLPAFYRNRSDKPSSELGRQWLDTERAIQRAAVALHDLAVVLEGKAGLATCDGAGEPSILESQPDQVLLAWRNNLDTLEATAVDSEPPAERDESFMLLTKNVPADKPANQLACIRWAANNLETDWSEIDAAEVPCRYALSLLKWAKSGPREQNDFMQLVQKAIKLEPEGDDCQRYHDDNRKKFKLIDDFERAFYAKQEAENAASGCSP